MPPKTSSASSSVPTFLPSKFKTSIFAIFQLMWTTGAVACDSILVWHRHSCLCSLLLTLTRSSFLSSLQRIDSCRSGKSTTLARRFLGLEDHHIGALRPRHRAFHQQQIVFAVD